MIEDYRVRGWRRPTHEDTNNQVAVYKAVPSEALGVIVLSLFRDGAVRVVVEDEATWTAVAHDRDEAPSD